MSWNSSRSELVRQRCTVKCKTAVFLCHCHFPSTHLEEKSTLWAASHSHFEVTIASAIPSNEVTEIFYFLCGRPLYIRFVIAGIFQSIASSLPDKCFTSEACWRGEKAKGCSHTASLCSGPMGWNACNQTERSWISIKRHSLREGALQKESYAYIFIYMYVYMRVDMHFCRWCPMGCCASGWQLAGSGC